jgi:hypothetical protein
MEEQTTTHAPLMQPQEHAQQIKRRTYAAILEMSAKHPLLNATDIAMMLGTSEPWVKKIMRSDAFIAQRANRVQELHGPRLQQLQAKLETTTDLILDAIAKRIANPEAAVSEDTLLKAAALLLDRIIPKKTEASAASPLAPAQPSVTMVFNSVTAADIARARDAALHRGRTLELEPQSSMEIIPDVDEDGLPTPRRIRSNEGLD